MDDLTRSDPRSDEALMLAYRDGDAAAFRVLFERYAPALLRATRRHVRSPEDATEIVQQTFLQLHRARADFDTNQKLRPWLYTICLNLRREHFRRRSRRPEVALIAEDRLDCASAPHDPLVSERMRQVRAAVDALPAGQREVIALHWFQDMPFKDVASAVGASVTAVKVRAHRGYERLRATLGGIDRNQDQAFGIPALE